MGSMPADPKKEATRFDIKTMLRYPAGTDKEILKIYLEYNDILVTKGIGSYNIWMKRANYLYALERLEEAVLALDMALEHDPRSSEGHFLKGVCLQLIALRENEGSFDGMLGEIPLRLLKEAKRAFETALMLNPADDEAVQYITNLRCLLYSPGGREEATEASAGAEGAVGAATA